MPPYGYYPYYQQPVYQQQPQQRIDNPVQQMQNSGFISVPSEGIVASYPIAPGNCMTFKIEGKPIVMEKSMGFSQLESPKIKRYRLVEEEEAETIHEAPEVIKPAEIEKINKDISDLWDELNSLKNMIKRPVNGKKKVEVEDDTE